MTKLYMVVLIFGRIFQTVGPLPYGMDECRQTIRSWSAEIDAAFIEKGLDTDPVMVVDGRRIARADIVLRCVEASTRPDLGAKLEADQVPGAR